MVEESLEEFECLVLSLFQLPLQTYDNSPNIYIYLSDVSRILLFFQLLKQRDDKSKI